MGKYLLPALIIIAVCGVALLVFSFLRRLKITSEYKRILGENISCDQKTDAILKLSFPKKNIISNVSLPLTFRNENNRYANIEHILVGHGGVAVISSYDLHGSIDNPLEENWICYEKDGSPIEIENPLRINQGRMHGVETVLKHVGISGVPIHSVIVIPSKNTKFRYRREEILRAGQLLGKMSDLNKNKFLSGSEIRQTVNALNKFAVSAAPAENGGAAYDDMTKEQ